MSHDHGSAIAACLATGTSCWVNWYDVIGDGFALLTAVLSFILVAVLIRKHLIETRFTQDNERRNEQRRIHKREAEE